MKLRKSDLTDIIFLEEIENPYPMGLDHALSEYDVNF